MKLFTTLAALSAAHALVTPILDTRNLPERVGIQHHDHLDYHLGLRAREDIDARALQGGEPSGPGPAEVKPETHHNQNSPIAASEEKPPETHHNQNSPIAANKEMPPVKELPKVPAVPEHPKAPVVPVEQSSPIDTGYRPPPGDKGEPGDTPAEDIIELLDKTFGETLGEGPDDNWHGPDEVLPVNPVIPNPVPYQPPQQAPAEQPPPTSSYCPSSTRPKKEIVVFETEIVVVTSILQPNKNNAVQPTAPPPQAPPPKAQPQPEEDALANNRPSSSPAPPPQPKPKPQPQVHQVKPAQPAPQPQAAPQQQPKPQEQPKPQPQPKPQAENVQTVPKPQPSQKEPAGNPSQGSGINTDGLPTEFVNDLSCDSDVYKGLAKLHHDIHRTNHSLDVLAWNDTLYEYAKETAESCIYGHSLAPGGGGYGQNIAAGDAPGNISATLTNVYYNTELPLFFEAIGQQWGNNDPDMGNFENWGHATQMLWKDTTSFACYTATCSPPGADAQQCKPDGTSYLENVPCGDGGTYAYNMVCNYYPPGNYANEYSAVPAPDGKMGFVEITGNGVVGL